MNLKTMSYGELIKHAEDVLKAVRLRAYSEGYAQGKFDANIEELYGKATPAYASQQHYRDEIIEKAKRDIEALKVTHHPTLEKYYVLRKLTFMPDGDADFIVNKTKRTVVCLMRRRRYDGKGEVLSKGIAKCNPSDCFNVHIGKAIALRRALGLEVPAEYYNAPQPTEVRVGDVVRFYYADGYRPNGEEYFEDTVTGFCDEYAEFDNGEISSYDLANRKDKVIDDSREEVGE